MTNSAPETSRKLLLSVREAAKALSVSERTLWNMTAPRGPIPSIRLGSRVLYSTSALQKWIDGETGAAGEVES
jgi:excisionase family DNA binding protein